MVAILEAGRGDAGSNPFGRSGSAGSCVLLEGASTFRDLSAGEMVGIAGMATRIQYQ